MFDLQLHLRLAGLSLILLAFAHIDFSKRFHWREELTRLSLLNRQIFHVHSFFICLVLVQMGLLCLLSPQALLASTLLGQYVALGFTVFWSIRLYSQWFVYEWALWQGKSFETVVHVSFSLLWTYYVAVFGAVMLRQFYPL